MQSEPVHRKYSIAHLERLNSLRPNDTIWEILVNIGLSNSLFPDGTKSLSEPK